MLVGRELSTTMSLLRDRGAERSTREKVRALNWDKSVNEVINLDTLAKVEDGVVEHQDDVVFNQFPDENTSEQMFNGIVFKDLPYVTMVLHRNNTKLYAR